MISWYVEEFVQFLKHSIFFLHYIVATELTVPYKWSYSVHKSRQNILAPGKCTKWLRRGTMCQQNLPTIEYISHQTIHYTFINLEPNL